MHYINSREKDIQSAMAEAENEISQSSSESLENAIKLVNSQLSKSKLLSSELCKARSSQNK